MSDDATPRLSLPYLAAAQAQKHVTLNQSLGLLDGLVQTAVESRTTAAEPSSPVDGAIYILPASATGADWTGFAANTVMRFEAGAWTSLPLRSGWLAYVKDEGAAVVCDGAAWVDLGLALRSLANLALLGIGTTADADNPLSVKANAVLFDHARAGDVQVKIDKAASANNASVLFQTGYSGRAEVGLCGDDAFHLRVSTDGSAFTDALIAQSSNGYVGLGVSAPTARLQVDGAIGVKAALLADLPAASAEGAGAIRFVTNESGGATLVFSDGTDWRRTSDRAVAS